MKKVLIIGHFWPYHSGSCRVIGLAKYLPEFGWEPIILTGPLNYKPESSFRFIEVDYPGFLGSWVKIFGFVPKKNVGDQLKEKVEALPSGHKSFLRFFYNRLRGILAYPDEDKFWKKPAIEAASRLFKKEKIDALISVWPTTSHLIAKKLKEDYKIPWFADFPDPWSENHDYHYGFLRKIIDRNLEKKTLTIADALTTVTVPWAESLKRTYRQKQVYPISHGFDPVIINSGSKVRLTPEFTITYTGQIYQKKQQPNKFLIALKELIEEKIIEPDKIKVRFFGSPKSWLAEEIKKIGLEPVVKQHGLVSKEMSLEKQRESQILLLFNWEDPKEKGVCPIKIFEYLANQRPILATGGGKGDAVEKILSETKAGTSAFKIEDIKKELEKFYSEYKQKNRVDFYGDTKTINKYSQREMANKFADILNKITWITYQN